MTAAILEPTATPTPSICPVGGQQDLGIVPTRPSVLVALGDSVTAGVGDSPEDGGWSGHLAALLGITVINLGRNGARARDVAGEQLAAALAIRPDLATVFIGGNDVLRGDFDACEVQAAVLTTVRALRRIGTQVVVVLPPPIGPELPAPQVVRRVLGRRMNLVRQSAQHLADAELIDVRCTVVDAQDVLAGAGSAVFHIDRIHPSPLGHRRLAEVVADRLDPADWPTVGATSPVPAAPPLALRIGWLIMRGIPWVARRSRDLLPELVRTVITEEWARRRSGEP